MNRAYIAEKVPVWMLVLNALFWVCFFVAFFTVSVPYNPQPGGWEKSVNPFVFWGRSLSPDTLPTRYLFFRLAYWLQWPSMAVGYGIHRLTFWSVSADRIIAGVSVLGIRMLGVVLLSFGQWYLIVRLIRKVLMRSPQAGEPSGMPQSTQ
jgi:hypothetical protein